VGPGGSLIAYRRWADTSEDPAKEKKNQITGAMTALQFPATIPLAILREAHRRRAPRLG
jgi:hypothetical protein